MSLPCAFRRAPDMSSTGDVSVLSYSPMHSYLVQWYWLRRLPPVRDLPYSDRRSKSKTLKPGSWLST